MLTWILCCAIVTTNGSSARPAITTEWLASGHPNISVMADLSEKENCTANCDHYVLLLSYRSSAPATSGETDEWSSFSNAGCFDIVGSEKSFACRVPGAISGESKNGQHYATSRFHVRREQLLALANTNAFLRIQNIELHLPPATRIALKSFLQEPLASTTKQRPPL